MNNWNSMKLATLNCSCAKFSWENFCAVLTQIAKQFCVVIINQGGGVAAPVASQVLGEVLPYLEVKKISEADIEEEVIMPNIEGVSIKEAEKIIKELCLEIKIEEGVVDKENTTVKEQIPKEGVKVNKGSKIIVKY